MHWQRAERGLPIHLSRCMLRHDGSQACERQQLHVHGCCLAQVVRSNNPTAVSRECPLLDAHTREQAQDDIVKGLSSFGVEVLNEPGPSLPTTVQASSRRLSWPGICDSR